MEGFTLPDQIQRRRRGEPVHRRWRGQRRGRSADPVHRSPEKRRGKHRSRSSPPALARGRLSTEEPGCRRRAEDGGSRKHGGRRPTHRRRRSWVPPRLGEEIWARETREGNGRRGEGDEGRGPDLGVRRRLCACAVCVTGWGAGAGGLPWSRAGRAYRLNGPCRAGTACLDHGPRPTRA